MLAVLTAHRQIVLGVLLRQIVLGVLLLDAAASKLGRLLQPLQQQMVD